MLSRVAERIYWMARYLERAENTARLVNVNSHLLLDLPRIVTVGWSPLVDISGNRSQFDELYDEPTERAVVKFLIADQRNQGSLVNSIRYARENTRTIRDIMPNDVWEAINNLHDLCKQELPNGLSRKNRFAFLQQIIAQTQQITGLLAGTMLHNIGYSFLKLGRNLERADMTTRIIDVRTESIVTTETEDLVPFEQIQWVSVLHSMSAYQSFRQEVQGIIRRDNVLRFLTQNRRFPRSFAHCIQEVRSCFSNMPRSQQLITLADSILANVERLKFESLAVDKLYLLIDELQIELAQLHQAITSSYFSLERNAQKPAQQKQVMTT
ncbi:MAG: alpha-E domain-containing protein [Gammaproteobacteria bacterium]|nr:alpha-E domain-containing protein [Gammaproteobacteria bacterium]